jgi:integrase
VALGNEIQRVRSVFKHAFDAELIAAPVRFGPGFKRPSKKVLRKARADKGVRLFQPAELRAVLDSAGKPFKAMILLGINCGYGNAYCATLPLKALDLESGWAHYPRPKTGIDRRCPLWPETVEAIREALNKRPTPKDAADAGLAFITKFGAGWDKSGSGNNHANPISWEMKKVLKSVRFLVVKGESNERTYLVGKSVEVKVRGQSEAVADIEKGAEVALNFAKDAPGKVVGIEVGCPRKTTPLTLRGKIVSNTPLLRPGLSFYTLRHCFETIGGDARDQPAVDHIMGHARDDMASVYREKISDERLRAVTDKVHVWLFGG